MVGYLLSVYHPRLVNLNNRGIFMGEGVNILGENKDYNVLYY